MGDNKKKSTQEERQTTTTTATATPEEQQLNQLGLEQAQAAQPGLLGLSENIPNILNLLLTGQGLPGGLQGLLGGINQEAAQGIAGQAVTQAGAFGQGLGLSGGAEAELLTDTARRSFLESQQFNIANMGNLLNTALTGGLGFQQAQTGQRQALGQQFAGLRPITQTGIGSTIQTQSGGMNPFLQAGLAAAGTAAGTAFGGPIGGAIGGSLFSAGTGDVGGFQGTFSRGTGGSLTGANRGGYGGGAAMGASQFSQ